MSEQFSKTRIEYQKGVLDIDSIDRDPFEQFRVWFDQALAIDRHEPNACALATVGADLQPSVRMVLLKNLDQQGFVFFSNYLSRKGRDLESNNRAALTFYWGSLERQVRIEGRVERVSDAESDEYFARRPRDSQFGSAVSRQSEVATSRAELEQAMKELRSAVGEGPVPRPPHWGGYRLLPTMFEFWQGRENRLHDRFQYTVQPNGTWKVERLWP
jgi:pyridoxamine 5'-phosphate oxidase